MRFFVLVPEDVTASGFPTKGQAEQAAAEVLDSGYLKVFIIDTKLEEVDEMDRKQ